MLNTLLIDDKPTNIHLLEEMLNAFCPQVAVVGTAMNIDDGYSSIQKLQPALVFLDIEMPGGSGFDLLNRFKQISFELVFVTAYNQYAIQAFKENAIDYILKPIDIDMLQKAVQKAERQIDLKSTSDQLSKYLKVATMPTGGKISLPVQDGYLFIDSHDIVRCEASGSYSWFFLKSKKKIMVSLRLKECEDILPPAQFFRIHNSHIINMIQIDRYVRGRGGYIMLKDGSTIEVAASKKDAFLKWMKQQ